MRSDIDLCTCFFHNVSLGELKMSSNLFEVQKLDKALHIHLPPLDNPENQKAFVIQAKQWLIEDCEAYLFDFSQVSSLSQNISREFSLFNRAIGKNYRKIFSININTLLLKEFKEKGILGVFNPINSMEEFKGRQNKLK